MNARELLNAYVHGIFPMADPDGTIAWYAPPMRAIIPLENYKEAKSLRSTLNRKTFEVWVNRDFPKTILACASPRHGETETWISKELIDVYIELHEMGYAHSIEAYQKDELVGGLYGVTIGSAFFGESMFYKVSNSSKVAFHFLVRLLRKRNFKLLDSQLINPNVVRYGAIEVPRVLYESLLKYAVVTPGSLVPGKGAWKMTDLLSS